jgi:hypothetical protein
VPVTAIKTEIRCKLCKSSKRAEIDAILEKRSKGESDADGQRYNIEHVLKLLAELGIENPTPDNVKVHWRKHCELIDEQASVEIEKRHRDTIDKFESGERVTADEVLDFIIFHGSADLKAKLEETGKAGITVDQVLKAVDAKTRRKHDESANLLLQAAAGGISLAFQRAMAPPAPVAPEIDGTGELIEDGEVTEVSA